MIQLRFFASLREKLDTGDEQIDLPEAVTTTAELTRWLQDRDKTWHDALADQCLLIALNQEIIRDSAPIKNGDEIAWFPPVTGG